MGVPAKIIRETTAEERNRIKHTVSAYLELQKSHRAGRYPAADVTPSVARGSAPSR
jgi:carbonic anhydrase/acetyltransferase-like protein (isoleucine patch superfamily)